RGTDRSRLRPCQAPFGLSIVDDILFWGATGQAKALHEALEGTQWRLVALVDRDCVPSPWSGIPVLRGEQGLDDWLRQRATSAPRYAAATIGSPGVAGRLHVMNILAARGLVLPTIIHRTAFVALDSQLG